MKKHFYSHLIEIDSLSMSLDELEMTVEEKSELIDIATSSIHHVVVDMVLSELPEKNKKLFLSYIVSDDHERIWSLLENIRQEIEKKIQMAVGILKEELYKDIQTVKKAKKTIKS